MVDGGCFLNMYIARRAVLYTAVKFMSRTCWAGGRGSPASFKEGFFSQGRRGFEATPAFGITMSRVFVGEKDMAALKAVTRSVHFVTSVFMYWALLEGVVSFCGEGRGGDLKWVLCLVEVLDILFL